MTRAREIILYTRPDCHLCEQAEHMLNDARVTWYPVDIETDLDLIRQYGTRIPVLFRPDIRRELFWPFTEESVIEFIDHEI